MANYDKPRGALFTNNRKEKETHPDLRGELEISPELVNLMKSQIDSGQQFGKVEIAAWTKHSDKAGKYLSVSANKPYIKPQESANAPSQAPTGQSFTPAPATDDKIPF